MQTLSRGGLFAAAMLSASALGTGPVMAAGEAPATVVFAYIEEPPFATEADGHPAGSDVDLARVVLARMGVKVVETRKVEFADMLPGVAAGRWTMNTGLFITPERCRTVAYSDPIWALADGMIVRYGNPRNITSYASAASDARATIGVVRGTVQAETARQEGVPPDRMLEFAAQDEILEAIRGGRVDAYPNTALGHRALLAKLGSTDLELAQSFQPPSRGGRPMAGYGAFSFAKADAAFVARFNEALALYLGSAEHRAMLSRYGFTDAEIEPAIAMRGRVAELCR